MKILVTGASGFIGSELIKHLNSKGHVVYGISRSKINSKRMFSLSLLDNSKLSLIFKKNKFDIVIHLAALLDNEDPFVTFQNNCEGTLNLLEYCKLNKIKKVVFASTHAVYGNTKYLPIDEDHPVTSVTNYALSKLIAENICKMYSYAYGMNIVILRISSVYGSNQSSNYLIPKIIIDIIRNKKINLHEYLNGYQLMDLIHINDVCRAIDHACKLDIKFGLYNIASGNPITVKDIGLMLSKIIKINKVIIKKIPREINHFYYDVSKAKNELGFTPKMPFSTKTLTSIVNYVKKQR